jgi:hypothetical protein
MRHRIEDGTRISTGSTPGMMPAVITAAPTRLPSSPRPRSRCREVARPTLSPTWRPEPPRWLRVRSERDGTLRSSNNVSSTATRFITRPSEPYSSVLTRRSTRHPSRRATAPSALPRDATGPGPYAPHRQDLLHVSVRPSPVPNRDQAERSSLRDCDARRAIGPPEPRFSMSASARITVDGTVVVPASRRPGPRTTLSHPHGHRSVSTRRHPSEARRGTRYGRHGSM